MRREPQKGLQAILWWVVWISLTILSFFGAVAIWSPIIARHFGSVREGQAAVFWVIAVFGTWMIFLVPLIVYMYFRVDKAYDDARIRREKAAMRFRSIEVPSNKRALRPEVASHLTPLPETIQGGHVVALRLTDGREIPYAFIAQRREILGLYNQREMSFTGGDVVQVIPYPELPPLLVAANWLRLDGVSLD